MRTKLFPPLLLLSLLALSLLASNVSLAAAKKPVLLDKVVAVVDKEALMLSDLNLRLNQFKEQLKQRGISLPSDETLRQQVLERLIIETIQLQIAKKTGLQIDDQSLNQALARIANQEGLTLEEFRQAIESEGLVFSQFREEIRQEMLIGQVRQRQLGQRLEVSELEIDNYLSSPQALAEDGREFRLGHLLVSLPANPSPEDINQAEDKAKQILERLEAGADFQQEVISSSSSDTALTGGDLGWRKAVALPSLFADQVPNMQVNSLLGPLRSPSGFHLIKLLEVRGGKQQLVEQTHARHLLLSPNAIRDEQATQELINQLKAKLDAGASFIELAKEHTDDKSNKHSGGDLHWVSPGQMVPEFEQAMNQLKVGEISAPVKTQFGWHLIKVEAKRQEDMTLSLKRNEVRQLLASRKFEEEVENWLREIRADTWVEIKEAANN